MPLGHLGINVPDLVAAKRYYDAVMPLLGYEEFFSADEEFSYRPVDAKPGTFLFFYPSPDAGDYSRNRSGLQHLASTSWRGRSAVKSL
jgi:catechol 2,3-dioxygenase-like lactoylglutathione lyase family enzyme